MPKPLLKQSFQKLENDIVVDPGKSTYRIQYLDDKGRRCTAFLLGDDYRDMVTGIRQLRRAAQCVKRHIVVDVDKKKDTCRFVTGSGCLGRIAQALIDTRRFR